MVNSNDYSIKVTCKGTRRRSLLVEEHGRQFGMDREAVLTRQYLVYKVRSAERQLEL